MNPYDERVIIKTIIIYKTSTSLSFYLHYFSFFLLNSNISVDCMLGFKFVWRCRSMFSPIVFPTISHLETTASSCNKYLNVQAIVWRCNTKLCMKDNTHTRNWWKNESLETFVCASKTTCHSFAVVNNTKVTWDMSRPVKRDLWIR